MATQPKHLWTEWMIGAVDPAYASDIKATFQRWESQDDLWAWALQALRDGRGLPAFHQMLLDDSARWGLRPEAVAALMETAVAYQGRNLIGVWRFLIRKPLTAADLPRIFTGLDSWHGSIPDLTTEVRKNPYLLIQLDDNLLRDWFPHVKDEELRVVWMHFLDRLWAKAPERDAALHTTWRQWAAVIGMLLDQYRQGHTYLYLQHPKAQVVDRWIRPALNRVRIYLQEPGLSDSQVLQIIRDVVALCDDPATPVVRSYRVIKSRDGKYEKIAWMWVYIGEKALADQVEQRLEAPIFGWPAIGDAIVARGYLPPGSTAYQPFDIDQQLAIRHAYTHPFTILAAPPGTGKTAVIWALHEIARHDPALTHDGFFVFTPTGRAARVVNDRVPGMAADARTLHSAVATLTWAPPGATVQPFTEQVGQGFVIVDESFNADAGILGALVRRLGPQGRLVFIGDPDQLLPVTGGSPVFDILRATREAVETQLIAPARDPVVTLHQNHRSVAVIPHNGRALWADPERDATTGQVVCDAQTGEVVTATHRWDAQHFPQIDLADEASAVETALVHWVQQWVQTGNSTLPSETQWHVVTHRRKSAQYLNQKIREVLFPGVSAPWVVGDRVLQLHNDYSLNGIGLRNGEFGHITAISRDQLTAKFGTVEFTVSMQYANTNWDYGYVTTVYKAQGGEWHRVAVVEWPIAWIPAELSETMEESKEELDEIEEDASAPETVHSRWRRRELYTAWSRARDLLVFLSPEVEAVVAETTRTAGTVRETNDYRRTQLWGWLRQRFQGHSGPRPGGPGVRRTL